MTLTIRTVAGLTLAGLASGAGATSFYLNEQSIKAAGRAFSGEAADQGPEQLWWNPAAIAGTRGVKAALGAALILPRASVEDRGSTIARPGQPAAPVGGDPTPRNPAKKGVLPSGAIAFGLSDRVAIGVAVTSPFSFETDYAADSWTRYIADRTKLTTIDIQPSVAVMLTDRVRIGAGLNIEYSDAILSKYLPNVVAALPDGRQALKGDGWDLGWSAGAQYVTDGFSAGIAYKSAVRHRLDGTLEISGLVGPLAGGNIRLDTRASFSTPWQAIGSIRYDLGQLTLNAQVTRFGWSEFDRVRLAVPPGAFVPEDYRDSWTVAGGADWRVDDRLTLRGGVYRDQTPTRNGKRDPNVPDANRTAVALGASLGLGDRLTLDLAAEYLFIGRSSIDRGATAFEGTPAASIVTTNGVLARARAVILGIGARASF